MSRDSVKEGAKKDLCRRAQVCVAVRCAECVAACVTVCVVVFSAANVAKCVARQARV